MKTHCIICCLTESYQNDSQRQAELQYCYKSQHHLIPILFEHGFEVQQTWLGQILESLQISIINFSESITVTDVAWQELHRALSELNKHDDKSVAKASHYLNIYEECQKQGWDNIPQLLLYIPAILIHDAIDKRKSHDMKKMIHLMYTINNRFSGTAQLQINKFQQWLENINQINQETDTYLHPIDAERKTPSSLCVRNLHDACGQNDIQHVRDILQSCKMNDLDKAEKHEQTTALSIASRLGHHEIVRILLEHGDLMAKRNQDGSTPFRQAKDERTKEIFVQYQHLVPRFAGDLLEWTVNYREPAIKRAQIREILRRNHFIVDSFTSSTVRYVRCYLALEGFSIQEIKQLESMTYTSVEGFIRAYTSTTRFHKYINRHLAIYALPYFDSSFNISIPYSFIHCLLSVVAFILNYFRVLVSFVGHVYRGMLITKEDLYRYVVGSRVLNTAFLSTSKNRVVAEIFAGIKEHETSSTHDPANIHVLSIYNIRNQRTAYDIEQLSNIQMEDEVLIFPFSAFCVTRVEKKFNGSVEIELNECDLEEWTSSDDIQDMITTRFGLKYLNEQ
ncbi:unnamed protein product [Rotaria magnacalcarata]|uniref:NAD(P)(+)--arginine ADP-ribosyltransferase n=4 Tax=Rotaria magnacalcarata TaxID=392030 RepID=A0A816VNW5_9BILA|nr:unnamed protein product [Rotaria magnacalcarata]